MEKKFTQKKILVAKFKI